MPRSAPRMRSSPAGAARNRSRQLRSFRPDFRLDSTFAKILAGIRLNRGNLRNINRETPTASLHAHLILREICQTSGLAPLRRTKESSPRTKCSPHAHNNGRRHLSRNGNTRIVRFPLCNCSPGTVAPSKRSTTACGCAFRTKQTTAMTPRQHPAIRPMPGWVTEQEILTAPAAGFPAQRDQKPRFVEVSAEKPRAAQTSLFSSSNPRS